MWKMFQKFKFVNLLLVLIFVSCNHKEAFTQLSNTDFFTVDHNPAYLDVLWVVDDRSSLFTAREHLISESKKFFQRLDSVALSYRMGFITSDMLRAKGALQPLGSPIILEKSSRTLEERTALFGQVMTQLIINLGTGAESKGFAAAELALTKNFKPRSGVPLVVVFISDADDRSEFESSSIDAVDYYSKLFLSSKGNNTSSLRVYSINYLKLTAGMDVDAYRCATRYDADIDSTRTNLDGTAYFQDRYFKLAEKLGGDTADLCGSFASKINLDGIRIKELPKRFTLSQNATVNTLLVDVFVGETHYKMPWKYLTESKEIVFESAPPEGSTIQVTYLPN